MKFNRTGYWLLALFGGGGLLILAIGLIVPAAGFVMIPLGGIWFLVAAGLVAYNHQQGKKGEHERWLFQNGIRGTGTVVNWSSNTTINDEPVVKLVLDVDVPGQGTRRLERKILMSRFAAYRMKPGVVLPVHVNPRDANDLLVRW